MNISIFYLSEDKKYLMDGQGQNVYSIVQENEHTFYKPIMIESEAIEKVCMTRKSIKVCSLWDETTRACLAFVDVDVCTQWKLIPKGYSNIS